MSFLMSEGFARDYPVAVEKDVVPQAHGTVTQVLYKVILSAPDAVPLVDEQGAKTDNILG